MSRITITLTIDVPDGAVVNVAPEVAANPEPRTTSVFPPQKEGRLDHGKSGPLAPDDPPFDVPATKQVDDTPEDQGEPPLERLKSAFLAAVAVQGKEPAFAALGYAKCSDVPEKKIEATIKKLEKMTA